VPDVLALDVLDAPEALDDPAPNVPVGAAWVELVLDVLDDPEGVEALGV
jgi:hypothetical protein